MLNLEQTESTAKVKQALLGKTELNQDKVSHAQQQKAGPTTEREAPQKKRVLMIVLAGLFLFISGIIGLAFYSYSVINQLKSEAEQMQQQTRTAYTQFKQQNLPETKKALDQAQVKLSQLSATYTKLSFFRFIPLARAYYGDGQHGIKAAQSTLAAGQKAIDALVPYADVLGFAGKGSFTGGTAEDRLGLILKTIDKLLPQMDAIQADLKNADEQLAQINPQRYPKNYQNLAIRAKLVQAREALHGANEALSTYRPVIARLPSLAGAEGRRKKYLVLFQNDNELRPTGGFLTAYAVVFVENGKVTPEKSDDIYELDKKFRKRIPIPPELGRYLTTEKYWHLRDMNINPDFKQSMDTFYKYYQIVPGEPHNIDGIIALDTQFLVHLMEILGPVKVPGYGTFSAEIDKSCDCPQIIHVLSEIITRPTPYIRKNRKGILGPLMRAIIVKAYGAPKSQWPGLFQQFFTDIEAKHIQFYFMNQADEKAAALINATGQMQPRTGEDYFAVVDANLAGAKSNLYVKESMTQTIKPPVEGKIEKTVEITYKNPRRADNCNLEAGLLCLNSTLKDWNRIYLPAGAKLIKAQGYLEPPKVHQAQGFTVVDGFFILEPKSVAKLKLNYQVPYKDEKTYRLHIFKQAGIAQYPLLLNVNGNETKLMINKDTDFSTQF